MMHLLDAVDVLTRMKQRADDPRTRDALAYALHRLTHRPVDNPPGTWWRNSLAATLLMREADP